MLRQITSDRYIFIECIGVDLSDFQANIYQKAFLTLLYISHFTIVVLFSNTEEKLFPIIKSVIDLQQCVNNNLTRFHQKLILMVRDSGCELDFSDDHIETTNRIQIQSDQMFKDNLINLLQTQINSLFIPDDLFVCMQPNPKFNFHLFLASVARAVGFLTYLPTGINRFDSTDFIALFQMFSVTILATIDNHVIQTKISQIVKNFFRTLMLSIQNLSQ
jgi:hypothetical protein